MASDIILCIVVPLLFLVIASAIISPTPPKKRSKPKNKASFTNPIFIYVLKDGRSKFYVGRSRDPKARLRGHISSASFSGTDNQRYIAWMLAQGRTPTIHIITKTRNETKAKQLERTYVKRWGKTNVKLRK